MILQWFSLVTVSLVKMIGELFYLWTETHYSRWAYIYYRYYNKSADFKLGIFTLNKVINKFTCRCQALCIENISHTFFILVSSTAMLYKFGIVCEQLFWRSFCPSWIAICRTVYNFYKVSFILVNGLEGCWASILPQGFLAFCIIHSNL